MAKNKEEVKKSIFTDETVFVKFIPDFRNGITDKKHPLYGGMSSNASIGVPAPLLTREIKDIFTPEEIEALEAKLPGEDLNPTSDFWKEFSKDEYGMPRGIFPIYLKKEGMMLNKKNAIDYIKIRILEHAKMVAINEDEINNRKSEYRFVLIKHGDIGKKEANRRGWKKDAIKLHTKYEKDALILRHALKGFNKNPSYNNKIEFLQEEAWKLLEVDPKRFVTVLSDPLIDAKVILDQAVRFKLVSVANKLYYTKSGDPIRLDGHNNDYEGAAKFLDSGAGQEFKLELEATIKTLA